VAEPARPLTPGGSHLGAPVPTSRSVALSGDRVLYICQTFPQVTQTFTVREVALLRQQGLDVEVVSFRPSPRELLDSDARALLPLVSFLPPIRSPEFVRPVLRAFSRRPVTTLRLAAQALVSSGLLRTPTGMRMRGVLAVARGAWIATSRPDAAWFHAEFADEAATAAMAASELTGRRFSFKSHASFNPQQLERKAERAAFVATESEFTRRHYFDSLPDERVLVNRGGVLMEPLEPRDRPGKSLLILSVGTLQAKKGHRYLLGALQRLRDQDVAFRCLIVGSGPLEGDLRARVSASSLGDRVSIEHYCPHEEVERLYEKHDVFVLPCIVTDDGDRDGIPAVLIEAASAGCALVSTPVSGVPELVRDGFSGLLVPERDEVALAAALARLAGDPELLRALAAGARSVVEELFDLRSNVAQLAERFRLELARNRTATATNPGKRNA
jgi:glycosyltransferase involved in cell wall biosynthesis